MSTAAPTLALAVDWQDSEMFFDSAMGVRLAWISLLTHTRAQGRAGKVRFRELAFVELYRLNIDSVSEMLRRATEAQAIAIQGEFVIVVNWKLYQERRARSDADDGSSTEKVAKVVKVSQSNPTETAADKQEGLFKRFWNAFPSGRKTKPGKARITFAKASAKVDPEIIIAAATEYAASDMGQSEYVSGPEPWLNGECWGDDRSAWKRSQGPAKGRDKGESSLF